MSSTSAIISLVFVQNHRFAINIPGPNASIKLYLYIYEIWDDTTYVLILSYCVPTYKKYLCTASDTGIQPVFLLLGHSRLPLISKRNDVKNTETEMVARESFSSETDLILHSILYKLWRSTKKAHACLVVAEIRPPKRCDFKGPTKMRFSEFTSCICNPKNYTPVK